MRLGVQITLGDDAMRSGSDLAKALRAIAERLDGVDLEDEARSELPSGVVRDANGNTVGRWALSGKL